MKDNTWWVIAGILIQTLFILLITSSIMACVDLYFLQKAVPYLNLGLVLICVFNLFNIKNIEIQVKELTQARLLKNHLHQVESMMKTANIQQHECSKHIQTIQALIELEKIARAKEYINGIASQYWSDNLQFHIGHPAISALINSKSSVAQLNNIDFAVAVKCDLADIDIPAWDLCSMIGNLLDNAIEAAMADLKPRVGVEFKYEDGYYVICVINNGSRITDLSSVFEAGFTTKGSDSRGYGLYIVNKLVNKYQGSIEIFNKSKNTVMLKLPGAGEGYDEKHKLKYS